LRYHDGNESGLLQLNDHVVYDVAGRQRQGFITDFRYDSGLRGTSAAVQPTFGGPRIWIDAEVLLPIRR
jgi:hypothetical protein